MNIKSKLSLIFFMLLSLILAGCSFSPRDEENFIGQTGSEKENPVPDFKDNENNAENSSLFLRSGNHSYIFFTDNKKYIRESGYTFWCTSHECSSDVFEPIEFSAYKESGSTESGYGVVFCNQSLEGQDFLMCVMINTRGQYIIGKVIDGEFLTISNWKSSSLLHKGIGIKNKIKIIHDEQKKVFVLSFNGYFACDFSPVENTKIYGGKSGYVVVVSNLEKFPKSPVKVRFEGVSGL